jgi:hypothetical protein
LNFRLNCWKVRNWACPASCHFYQLPFQIEHPSDTQSIRMPSSSPTILKKMKLMPGGPDLLMMYVTFDCQFYVGYRTWNFSLFTMFIFTVPAESVPWPDALCRPKLFHRCCGGGCFQRGRPCYRFVSLPIAQPKSPRSRWGSTDCQKR